AMVRTMAERPRLNRFIAGQRTFQHRDITLAFAVKLTFADHAPITTVKIAFQPDDTLDQVARRVVRAVHAGRSDKPSTSDTEAKWLSRLPRPVLRTIMQAQRWLDDRHLLPAALTQDDPLYASAMLANLGSIGLDAPYHHLFEYGTVPIFVTIGRIKKVPMVVEDDQIAARQAVSVKFSIDERIADGYYLGRSLERFRHYVQHPQNLQSSASSEEDNS
ncbi:MAG: 2-oxo acid dehydrogenase subunit E2, partial [Myxococcota bacterium]